MTQFQSKPLSADEVAAHILNTRSIESPSEQHHSKNSPSFWRRVFNFKSIGLLGAAVLSGAAALSMLSTSTGSTSTPHTSSSLHASPSRTSLSPSDLLVLEQAQKPTPIIADSKEFLDGLLRLDTPPALSPSSLEIDPFIIKIIASANPSLSTNDIKSSLVESQSSTEYWLIGLYGTPLNLKQFNALNAIVAQVGEQRLDELSTPIMKRFIKDNTIGLSPLVVIEAVKRLQQEHADPAVIALTEVFLEHSKAQKAANAEILTSIKHSQALAERLQMQTNQPNQAINQDEPPLEQIIANIGKLRDQAEALLVSQEQMLAKQASDLKPVVELYRQALANHTSTSEFNHYSSLNDPKRYHSAFKLHETYKVHQALSQQAISTYHQFNRAAATASVLHKIQKALIFLYADKYDASLPYAPAGSDKGNTYMVLSESINFLLTSNPLIVGIDEPLAQSAFNYLSYALSQTYPLETAKLSSPPQQ